MNIKTQISPETWSSFVNTHPEGTVFQSSVMFDLFEQAEKLEPLLLAALKEQDEICGLLLGVFIREKNGIGKILSTRFVIYGGPLLTGDEEEQTRCLDLLLDELVRKTQHKAIFIQFRNFTDQKKYLPVFERHGFKYLERLNYIVPIQNHGIQVPDTRFQIPDSNPIDFILGNMSDGRRRQIKKGLNSGAEIIAPENIEQLREFYDILHTLYRYKIRKPLPDWSFFEAYYKLTSEYWDNGAMKQSSHEAMKPIGIIRLIRFNGHVIGGILAPVFSDKCIYEWYVCGLDREYKDQYPSVLATWAAIQYAVDNNIKQFDFMGVGIPGREYGVREFKSRFGGKLVNYGRLTRINNKSLYHISELGYNVLASFKKI